MFYTGNIFFENCLQLEKIKNAELEGKEVHRVTPGTITETDHVFNEAGKILSHISIYPEGNFSSIPKQLFKGAPQKLRNSRSQRFTQKCT